MRSKPIRRVVIGVLGALALWLAPHASAQSFCHYEVTAIVPGPSCGIFENANVEFAGLNDLGQACGVVHECVAGEHFWPCVWTEELGLVILDLPPEADRGEAVDINNVAGTDGFGQVACTLEGGDLGGKRAYLYDDGEWINLGVLPEHTSSEAHAISDSTVIVGTSASPTEAVMWHAGVLNRLPLPLGPPSDARSIGANSEIVGWMREGITSIEFGYLHVASTTEVLPLLPGADSALPEAINILQHIVGHSSIEVRDGPNVSRSWLFRDEVLTDLGTPPRLNRIFARDINNADQVILSGSSTNPFVPSQGLLWQHGEMVDIKTLFDPVPGLSFGTTLSAINNRGQIAGRGTLSGVGLAGIILTPVNRPPGDVNIDCAIDQYDLADVLRDWGPCPERGSCLCDIVTSATFAPPGDGVVDGADLAVVLGNWSTR